MYGRAENTARFSGCVAARYGSTRGARTGARMGERRRDRETTECKRHSSSGASIPTDWTDKLGPRGAPGAGKGAPAGFFLAPPPRKTVLTKTFGQSYWLLGRLEDGAANEWMESDEAHVTTPGSR